MSLNTAYCFASLSGGETFTAGSVTESPALTHATASQTAGLSNGSGSGQAQHIVKFPLTVSTGGTTIDLTALTAAFGLDQASRNFSAIKGLIIENVDTTNNITVQPGAANGWTGINGAASGNPRTIEIGGFFSFYNPVNGLATSGTNKTVLISAAAGTASVIVSLVGVGS